MIVNLNEILPEARKSKKAVGAFNVYNYETIKGVVEAAVELEIPVVIAFGEKYLSNMSFEDVFSIVKSFDSKYPFIKMALHLDHCKSFENIAKAIRANFTSVMFDGSTLPFEENVKQTKKVVELAHSVNATVEAELGSIASSTLSHEEGREEIYTDPFEAEKFVNETKVDALAVSIGTVHGLYKGEPKINVNVLKEISKRVEIPLVLHGGSGTPEDVLKECIQNGIAKINVNTEISMNVIERISGIIREKQKSVHFADISIEVTKSVKETVIKYSRVFYFN